MYFFFNYNYTIQTNNILIFNLYDVFYMFRTWDFIFKKTVVYTGIVERVLHVQITINL